MVGNLSADISEVIVFTCKSNRLQFAIIFHNMFAFIDGDKTNIRV